MGKKTLRMIPTTAGKFWIIGLMDGKEFRPSYPSKYYKTKKGAYKALSLRK